MGTKDTTIRNHTAHVPLRVSRGTCRLCGKGSLDGRRRNWHTRCLAVYNTAYQQAEQWLHRRQRGRCARCGRRYAERLERVRNDPYLQIRAPRPELLCWVADDTPRDPDEPRHGPRLEIDHIVPLWKVRRMPPQRRRKPCWWLAGNLQLLCVPCHRAKTAEESAERAALRRQDSIGDLS